MTMVAHIALQLQPPRTGARPLNPAHDLGPVADLLESVFADDLDSGGRQMIREARMIAHSGRLLFLLSPWFGASNCLCPGVVWEESGRLVGNVTLMESAKSPGSWQIANVAVHPDYRRRGTGTRLLEATIDRVRKKAGRSISLQVRDSNPAVGLYQRLGFRSLGAVTRWQSGSQLQMDSIRTTGRPVRPAVRDDWLPIWQLFHAATPAAHGWPDPLTKTDFRPSWWRGIIEFLNGENARRWVTPAAIAGVLDGYAELRTSAGWTHRLTLRVRREAAGDPEGDLLREALLHRAGPRHETVLIDHPAGDLAVEDRLREADFRPHRTLVTMQLDLSR